MINERPILVTGHPRSGAGIVMGVLHICGAELGQVDKMNENWLIRDKVMKLYLQEVCGESNGITTIPTKDEFSKEVNDRYEETLYWMLHLQNITTKKWAYKDSRILLTYDSLFDSVYPGAQYIVVRRNDEDILNSCCKTTHTAFLASSNKRVSTKKESPLERFKISLEIYKEKIKELKSQKHIQEVWLEKTLDGDYTELKNVVEAVGLEWKEQDVKAYITKKLKKRRNK